MTTSINHDIMYKHFFKRIFDFVLALLALVCLSPLLLVVAVWLHFANKGAGVFFLQQRPGLHGKLFKIIKFKTMTDERAPDGTLLPDMQRLTRVGRFVRSTSIDELPQLVNVLKGDMALIGPRPLLPQYLPLYSPEQARRHDVRPGITGHWLGPVPRPQRHLVGRKVQARCVVCRPPLHQNRYSRHFRYNKSRNFSSRYRSI